MSITQENALVEVEIRPLKDVIGTHKCILEAGQSLICKRYYEQEVWFYEHTPKNLKNFIPKYHGEVSTRSDMSEGHRTLYAMVPRDIAERASLTKGWTRHALMSDKERQMHDCDGECKPLQINYTCMEDKIMRNGYWENGRTEKYILLENLVGSYTKPCVIDIKIYRKRLTEYSDELQRAIESGTALQTFNTLGLLVIGSQSYKGSTDNYAFIDKYQGRNFNEDQAADAIFGFFHNGNVLRADVIRKIIKRLDDLKEAMELDKSLVFRSSSLLIVYDGATDGMSERTDAKCEDKDKNHIFCDSKLTDRDCCVNKDGGKCCNSTGVKVTDDKMAATKADVRLIDFALMEENRDTENVDENNIVGLKNLREMLVGFVENN